MSDTPPSPPTHDLPLWLPVIVVAVALAGGAAAVWWFMSSGPSSPDTIVVTETPQDRPTTTERGQRGPLPTIDPPPATTVTLKLEAATAQQAVAEFARASGIDVSLVSTPRTSANAVSLDLYEQPFLPALMELCRQIEAYPGNAGRWYTPQVLLYINRRTQHAEAPFLHAGLFMVQAIGLQAHGQADPLPDVTPQEQLRLRLHIFAEPMFESFTLARTIEVDEAVDEAGHSLLVGDPPATYQGKMLRNWWAEGDIILNRASITSTRLARIRGSAWAVIPVGTTEVRIDNPLSAAGTTEVIDGIELEFRGIRERGDDYEVTFLAHASRREPRIAHRFLGRRSTMEITRLFDASGNEFAPRTFGSTGVGDRDQYLFHICFNKSEQLGPPALLVLTTPEAVKQVRIPFEFHDLPLP